MERRASRLQRLRQIGGAPVVLPEIGRETSSLGLRPGELYRFDLGRSDLGRGAAERQFRAVEKPLTWRAPRINEIGAQARQLNARPSMRVKRLA